MPASRSLMFRLSIPNDQLWVEQNYSTLTFSIFKVLIESRSSSTRKPKTIYYRCVASNNKKRTLKMVPKANDDGDLISLLMANLSPVFLCIGRKLRFLKKLFDVDCIVLKRKIQCKLTNMGSKANINIPKTFKIVHWAKQQCGFTLQNCSLLRIFREPWIVVIATRKASEVSKEIAILPNYN